MQQAQTISGELTNPPKPFDLDAHLKASLNLTSVHDLFCHFEDAIKVLGYHYTVFIFFPPKKDASEVTPICPYFNVSSDLISEYLSNKLYKVGPVFERAKTTGEIVVWSDVLEDSKKMDSLPELNKFVSLLQKYDFQDGFTIPAFGYSNSFGYISFTTEEASVKANDENIIILKHVCIDLLKQYLRITEGETEKAVSLTKREKEVLLWVLRGKSNPVIAEIMDISEHTVSTYISRSAKKLKAHSKWSAALTAVLTGLIHY